MSIIDSHFDRIVQIMVLSHILHICASTLLGSITSNGTKQVVSPITGDFHELGYFTFITLIPENANNPLLKSSQLITYTALSGQTSYVTSGLRHWNASDSGTTQALTRLVSITDYLKFIDLFDQSGGVGTFRHMQTIESEILNGIP